MKPGKDALAMDSLLGNGAFKEKLLNPGKVD